MLFCFVMNCRGLKSLEIYGGKIDVWWSMALADLEWLTHFKLNKCDFNPLPFKTIERLEIFTKSGLMADWIAAFIRMNPTLETVNVPETFRDDKLFQHVAGSLTIEYNLNGSKYKDEDDGFITYEPRSDDSE